MTTRENIGSLISFDLAVVSKKKSIKNIIRLKFFKRDCITINELDLSTKRDVKTATCSVRRYSSKVYNGNKPSNILVKILTLGNTYN